MTKSSRKRDYHQEYLDRKARAKARGFIGYSEERKARKQIASAYKSAGIEPPSPRAKAGRRAWDVIFKGAKKVGRRAEVPFPPAGGPPAGEVASWKMGGAEVYNVFGTTWWQDEEGNRLDPSTSRDVAGYARFAFPGEQWQGDRNHIEYRGRFQYAKEAVHYIVAIQRSQHVLIVVPVVDDYGHEYFEVYLDYAD